MHTKRLYLHGSLDLPPRPEPDYSARLWSRVDRSGDCWIWTGGKQHGYGCMSIRGRTVRVHRFTYEEEFGPIPEGADVDHVCRTPACVRPSHLRITSRVENSENRATRRSNTATGYRGITVHRGRYAVRVGHDGAMHWIGRFATLEEAVEAVVAARLRLHTHNEEDRRPRVHG